MVQLLTPRTNQWYKYPIIARGALWGRLPTMMPGQRDSWMEPLSTAELRALYALARFETAGEAAEFAGLSPQTLRNQAAKAYRKLGVNGKVEAFRKIGWLRPPRFMPAADDPDPFDNTEALPYPEQAPRPHLIDGGKI